MSANVEALNQVYEVFSKGNLDEFDAFVTDDFVEHEDLMGAPPTKEGVKQFIARWRAAFPDLTMRATHVVEQGDMIAARFETHGTHTGELLGIAPTGRSFSVSGYDLLRIKDGRASEHWGTVDTMSMFQQLGIQPPAPPAG